MTEHTRVDVDDHVGALFGERHSRQPLQGFDLIELNPEPPCRAHDAVEIGCAVLRHETTPIWPANLAGRLVEDPAEQRSLDHRVLECVVGERHRHAVTLCHVSE